MIKRKSLRPLTYGPPLLSWPTATQITQLHSITDQMMSFSLFNTKKMKNVLPTVKFHNGPVLPEPPCSVPLRKREIAILLLNPSTISMTRWIRSLHKVRPLHDPRNYQKKSHIHTLARIVERIVRGLLTDFSKTNKQLNNATELFKITFFT